MHRFNIQTIIKYKNFKKRTTDQQTIDNKAGFVNICKHLQTWSFATISQRFYQTVKSLKLIPWFSFNWFVLPYKHALMSVKVTCLAVGVSNGLTAWRLEVSQILVCQNTPPPQNGFVFCELLRSKQKETMTSITMSRKILYFILLHIVWIIWFN